jgi:hypothetical protein
MATVLTSLGELPVACGAAELTGRDAGQDGDRLLWSPRGAWACLSHPDRSGAAASAYTSKPTQPREERKHGIHRTFHTRSSPWRPGRRRGRGHRPHGRHRRGRADPGGSSGRPPGAGRPWPSAPWGAGIPSWGRGPPLAGQQPPPARSFTARAATPCSMPLTAGSLATPASTIAARSLAASWSLTGAAAGSCGTRGGLTRALTPPPVP